ncbi:MAG: hypothetical protein MJ070_05285 [Lachnospiraceae bacterium]|nr:hypothetical protein [Lachnospiraceae bacterium]
MTEYEIYDKGLRRKLCLNGLWEFAPSSGAITDLPETFDTVPIKVPSPYNINAFMGSHFRRYAGNEEVYVQGGDFRLYPEYPSRWEKAKCGFYRRSFGLKKEPGRRYFLRFDAVAFHCFFYLNGVLLRETTEGFLPIEIEITETANDGENVLLVACESAGYLTYKGKDGRNRLDFPRGSFFGEFVSGIWQDVWLIERPASYITDVFPVTDTRDRSLTVKTEAEAPDGASLSFFLKKWSPDGNHGEERALGSCPVSTDPFVWHWTENEIDLWDSFEPNLYLLTAVLEKDGQTLDRKTVRIGFRTMWAEGEKLILNGRPIKLKIDAWHYLGYTVQTPEFAHAYYRMARDAGVNIIRLHAEPFPEFFIDIADETGMMIVSESAVWASHCCFSYSPDFFENSKKHLISMLLRDRNHPSVVTWSPENECVPAYHFCGSDYVKSVAELEDKIWDFVKVIYDCDTSRLVSCDGSGDLGGRLPLNSIHYPHYDCPTKRGKPITIGEMGSMYYSTPDEVTGEYGRDAIESFDGRLRAVAEEAHHDLIGERKWAAQVCVFNLLWYGLRPLPFADRLLSYDDYTTPGIKPSRVTPYMRTLNAGADPLLPDYVPNPVWESAADAYVPARAFGEHLPSFVYTGEEYSFPVTVFNDLREAHVFTLTASLDGRTVTKELSVEAAEYAELTVPFTPETEGPLTLTLTLSAEGKELHSCSYPLTALNKEKTAVFPFPVVTEGDLPEGKAVIDCRNAQPYGEMMIGTRQKSFFCGRERISYPDPVPCHVFPASALFPGEPVLTDGKGNAVVLSLLCAGERRLISGLDLSKNDPTTAYLRGKVSEALKKEPSVPEKPYFLGDPASETASVLEALGCEPDYIDEATLETLLDEKQSRLLVIDAPFDRYSLFSANNFSRVFVSCPAAIPRVFRNELRLTGRNFCHIIPEEGEGDSFGLSSNALYGMEPGNEQILCRNSFECTRNEDILFGVPDVNFMAWNHIGEPLKTVAVARTEKTDNRMTAALVKKTYAGSDIYLSTLLPNADSPKMKNIWARLLSRFGVKFEMHSGDEFTDMIFSGVYSGGTVRKALARSFTEDEDLTSVLPGVNTVENGSAWRIVRESDRVREKTLYAFSISSPQDRRDLLLNPDYINAEISAASDCTVYLNGEALGTGKDLRLTGIPLASGTNRMVLAVPGSAPMPKISFTRVKSPRLDLSFSLRADKLAPIPMKGITWKGSVNPDYASHASFTRDHFWPTNCSQRPGITLDFTFPEEITARGLRFYSVKFRNDGDPYLPAGFRILAGPDTDHLAPVWESLSEKEMFYPRARVFVEFGKTVTARSFRIELTASAPREFVVEDLLLFR